MYEDYDPVDEFIFMITEFIESYTDFDNYEKMSEESKAKYVEKLLLMITFETSPRKNYDIGKDTLRLWIRNILEVSRRLENEPTES